ncbi:MAG: phage virion morphogenesis protein [Proteobacteria bacterium]|nr:phage virion morphogenesis protein [Pseudomonadota bacterium]
MTATTIQVSDQAVISFLNRMQNAVEHPQPIMRAIGEGVMERIKERFATATGPDGQPWAANSPVTLARYIESRGGKNFKKDGSLTKRGQALATSKKPLQGHTGDLAREFHVFATDNSVKISNAMIYDAMQQFGGTKAQFPHLWGDIPARPHFPITPGGDLYPQEADLIVAQLAEYIQGAATG